MLLPLGFGSWPARWPIAVGILFIFNMAFSLAKFSDVASFQDRVSKELKVERVQNLITIVGYKTCIADLKSEYCDHFFKSNIPKDRLVYNRNPKPASDPNISFRDVSSYMKSFHKNYTYWPETSKNSPHFSEIKNFFDQRNTVVSAEASQYNFLTPYNITPQTIMMASFIHTSYMHLFGNMLILVALGIYLEMAIGFALTFMTFIVGSYCGLFVEALFMNKASILLGASAGASAYIGCFMVLFWRAKMQFLFTLFPFYFKRLYLPVSIMLPCLYVAKDLAGAASTLDGNNVAHLGHLSGLTVGLLMGFVFKKIAPLSFPFLFEKEFELFQKAKKSSTSLKSFNRLMRASLWNKQNPITCHMALRKAQGMILSPDELTHLRDWTREVVSQFLSADEYNNAIPIFKYCFINRLDLNLTKSCNWTTLQKTADYCLSQNKHKEALFLYRELLLFKNSKIDYIGIKKTCANLEALLTKGINNEPSKEIQQAG